MHLIIFLGLCCVAATAGEAHDALDKVFAPRYTLLAESKNKDQKLAQQPSDAAAAAVSEQQPWRRLAYAGFGGQKTGWPVSTPAVSPAALLGPGLLLLGVNLGALLYMLLGLLGLAPAHRIGSSHAADIYRNDRQDLDAGKESVLYF